MERKKRVGVEKRENGRRIRKKEQVIKERKREKEKKARITRQKTEEN